MAKKVLANKRLRKGDKVVVVAGNDKGRTGEILTRAGDRVVVKGINVRKKHLKRSETNPNGIVEIECPIHCSNVMLAAEGDKGVRTSIRVTAEGERELVYKHDKEEVLHRNIKKMK